MTAGESPRLSQTSGGPDIASSSPLVVAIDFKQPHSYLALAPTRELARSCGIAIDWRPFAVPALKPPAVETADDRSSRHLRFRAHYVEKDLHRYAAAQGLVLRGLYRAPDSSLAGRGLLFAKRAVEHGAVDRGAVDAYVGRLFAGYWSEKLDLEDEGAIRQVLEAVGADGAAFDPEALRADYDRCQAELRAAGVIGAPAYLLGSELFLGRAHLPMIRWLLEGKTGPPPI